MQLPILLALLMIIKFFKIMFRFRYYFLISSIILLTMGALLKIENYANYNCSIIAGICNIVAFAILSFRGPKKLA